MMRPLGSFVTVAPGVAIAFAAALVTGGCQDSSPYSIGEPAKVRVEAASIKVDATSAERFGFRQPGDDHGGAHGQGHGAGGHGGGGAGPSIKGEAPEGWRVVEPTRHRIENFQIGEEPGVECYLTVLGGSGGGLRANIDRWRGQMSLPDLTDEEFAALKRVPMLGAEGVLADMEGAYSGMGSVAKDGYRMLGAAVALKDSMVFVKMTGPSEIVAAHREEFEAYCVSLANVEPEEERSMLDTHKSADWAWDPPEGWTRAPDRSTRIVTFKAGESGACECWVTELPGIAGGVAGNINRWRGQMGQTPLSDADIEGLTKVRVLNTTSTFVEIEGAYSGMSGESIDQALMYGIVCPLQNTTIFVKMVGPRDELATQRENFLSFCESLR